MSLELNGNGNGSSVSLAPTDLTSDFSAMAKLEDLASQGKGKIAVLLPDTQSSERYVSFDAPYLTKAFEAVGLGKDDFSIQNVQGSATTMQTQADAAYHQRGERADHRRARLGQRRGHRARRSLQGRRDDRLRPAHAERFVELLHQLRQRRRRQDIGQGLVDCAKQWHVDKPQVLEMDGDATDNNATLFAQGYNSVLKPQFDSGAYVKVGEPERTWDSLKALTNFEQQFTAHPDINAVVAANDTVANSVISVLKTDQVPAKTIPTTGQDASLIGLQNILAGYQCMSVYKPIYSEAQAAGVVALYVRAGQTPPDSLVNGKSEQPADRRPLGPAQAGVGHRRQHERHRGQGQVRGPGPAVRRIVREGLPVGRDRRVAVTMTGPASRDRTSRRRAKPPVRGTPRPESRRASKRFGPVQALRDVDLVVPAGEVTALAGDNGAGKSVLIKTIAGIHAPDGGETYWEGRPVHIRTPCDAAALGIQTVYQDLALADNLDIVQNMFLGGSSPRLTCSTRTAWRRRPPRPSPGSR